MSESIPQFLSVEDAAKLLNTSPATVTTAIESGKLPAIRLGETHRSTRINRDDLIPVDRKAADLRTRRLRKLAMEARDARELVARKRAELADAEQAADHAARSLEHELVLDEMDVSAKQRAA